MLRAAFTYPLADDDWLKTVLIGGVLSALGAFLFVPLLPVQGYYVRVLRESAAEATTPPVFDDWVDLTVDGILLLVVQVLYAIVPLAAVAVGLVVGGFGAFSGVGGTTAGAALEVVGWLLILAGALGTLVAIYLIPAAMAHFAVQDDVTAALALGRVTDAALSWEYFVAVVLVVVLGAVLGSVVGVLSVLLVGVFLGFYLQVSLYYLIGRGYARGLGLDG